MRLGPGLSPVIPRIWALGNLRGPAPRPAYPLPGRRLRLPTPAPRLAALPHRLAEAPLWLAPCGDGRGTRGRLLQQKSSEREGSPPPADSSRRRPTATPPAAPPAERQQGWGRGRSLPCLFLLPRSSQGTPKEHHRKLFAGCLVPNHRKLSR